MRSTPLSGYRAYNAFRRLPQGGVQRRSDPTPASRKEITYAIDRNKEMSIRTPLISAQIRIRQFLRRYEVIVLLRDNANALLARFELE